MVEYNFKKGKWYKNLGPHENYMAKFYEIENNDGWLFDEKKEYIYNSNYMISFCSCLTTDWKSATECNIEDLKRFLPKNHPDLLNIAPKIYELW